MTAISFTRAVPTATGTSGMGATMGGSLIFACGAGGTMPPGAGCIECFQFVFAMVMAFVFAMVMALWLSWCWQLGCHGDGIFHLIDEGRLTFV